MTPEEERIVTPDDPTEPAGEQDPANEARRIAETEAASGATAGVGKEGGEADNPDAPSDERDEPAGEAEQPAEEPEDSLARAERERDEYLELARRAQADFENYRKRTAKEMASTGARAKAALVRELLPVLDNLERALASADGNEGFIEGVRLVHSELVVALERNGVEAFAPDGERFDPTLHEALSTRSENGSEAGVVLEVVEKGYRLDDTVLRPARVVVSA